MNKDKINVAIIGITGEGKSTLINAVLGINVSMTDVGRPVTQEIFSYRVPQSELCLFDTKGFEIEESDTTVGSVRRFLVDRSKEVNINEKIHCLWLCVNAQSHRWQKVHADFVELCSSLSLPCIVVVTVLQ